MADDLSVVNSARVSFHKRSDEIDMATDGPDKGLINFLMKNRHGTPFEHNSFRFHVCAPIFVFREWHRHRIASINEWSARYSKLEPRFYIPRGENVRSQVGKPGSYTFEPVNPTLAKGFSQELEDHCLAAFQTYEEALEAGVAKELARLFLPVNIYSEMYWTVNARSLMNFLSLRNHSAAMFEIRQYAEALEVVFSQKMPLTWDAFMTNGRVAP